MGYPNEWSAQQDVCVTTEGITEFLGRESEKAAAVPEKRITQNRHSPCLYPSS